MVGYYQQDYQQQPLAQQPHLVYGHLPQQQVVGSDPGMRFEPQIDGTFDPSHYSDHSLDGTRSVPTTPIKAGLAAAACLPPPPVEPDSLLMSLAAEQETELVSEAPDQPEKRADPRQASGEEEAKAPATPAASAKGSPKFCEICGKQFEGKNRAMLKVQHLANHFKEKLFADLEDKSAPFRCPKEGCTYQTKHKPDWARHYGSVHHLIGKYLQVSIF
jgi:hypothetical protein